MSQIGEIEKEYNRSRPIFKKLFNMKCDKIKEIVKNILKQYDIEFCNFIDEADVVKELTNDEPWSIKINYYDQVSISFMGIYYNKEHCTSKLVTKLYDEFVKEEE